MAATREQVMEELKRRGVAIPDTAMPQEQISTITGKSIEEPQIDRKAIWTELRNRGLPDEEILKTFGKKPKEFWGTVSDEQPELIGGIIGGLIGAPLGFKGGVVGAGIGGGLAKGAQLSGKYLSDLVTGKEPITFNEFVSEIGKATGRQAAYEAGGRILVGGVQKALAPMAKKVIPGLTKVGQVLGEYMEPYIKRPGWFQKIMKTKPQGFTPAQQSDSWIVDTLEEVAEGSFTGGGNIRRFKDAQKRGFQAFVDDTAESMWKHVNAKLGKDEIGTIVGDTIEGNNAAFMSAAKALYKNVDDLTRGTIKKVPVTEKVTTSILDKTGKPLTREVTKLVEQEVGGARVSLIPLKEFANNILKTAEKRQGIGATQAGDSLLKKVVSLNDTISFADAQAIRAGLIDEISTMSVTKDKAQGLAKKFLSLTDSSMEQAARNLTPVALDAWRTANKFYKHGKTTFANKFIRKLGQMAKDSPDRVSDIIFQPGRITQIQKVKNAVDKGTWESLRASYLEKLITQSTKEEGVIWAKTFEKKLIDMGEPALKEIFTSSELHGVNLIAKIGTTIQKPTGGQFGVLIKLSQGGAIVGLAKGALDPTSAGTFIIGPHVLSRMLTNPITSRWFIHGLRLPANSPQAAALATKLVATAVKIEKERKKD